MWFDAIKSLKRDLHDRYNFSSFSGRLGYSSNDSSEFNFSLHGLTFKKCNCSF